MTQVVPQSRRRFPVRLVAVGAGLLAGVMLCELGLRVHHQVQSTRRAEAWRAVGKTHHRSGPVKLGHLVRPHADTKIIYELIPGLDLVFKGARVHTDSSGFRVSAEGGEPRGEGPCVVGLGDSVLFGWGVDYEDSYLSVLEGLLVADEPGLAIDFVNTGVPGYNTVMEVETMQVKGLAYGPDLVIIDHVSNDLAPPSFVPGRVDSWTLSRSHLVGAVRALLAGEPVGAFSRFGPAPGFGIDEREFWATLEFDPERVPPELRDLVGLGSYRRAMGELAELAREHGFAVVVTTHQKAPEYLREVCAELGFPLVETHPRIERYLQEHDFPTRVGSPLTVSADDPHPSALAHRFQAEELHRRLVEDGIWRELLERRRQR